MTISAISCSKDEEPTQGGGNGESELDDVQPEKTKIKEKITYRSSDHSEKFKERWNYDKSRRDTLYEWYEDGYIIERHLNYQYTSENGLHTKKYTRKCYLIGYQTATYTETVSEVYLDSAMTKIKEKICISRKDSSRVSYEYNDAGLCERVSTYENGALTRQTGNYVYGSKKCSYTEKYWSLDRWYTQECEVDYANNHYTLVKTFSIYREIENIVKLYECTNYEYNSIGQKTKEEYYNSRKEKNGEIVLNKGYEMSDFRFDDNRISYRNHNFADDEDFNVVEILLDI